MDTTARRTRWWLEAPVLLAVYELYSWARAHLEGTPADALRNARQVIGAERAVGGFHEMAVQTWILGSDGLVRAANVYYGSIHFVVPVLALIVLWRRAPDRYRVWRNAFGAMLGLALIGFAFYPVTPPRLLPARYEFVDTTATVGGIGPIGEPEDADEAANLYAAMPSLHAGWSTWCALALWPMVRRRRAKVALAAYPIVTLFVVVVTANHYWLDAVGGVVVLAGGLACARAWEARRRSAPTTSLAT